MGVTTLYLFQAEHLTSCYWGGSSNALDRHDPSLPYLEQYRIDFEQFKGMFVLLFPWACGTHSDVLASRLFQLLDENGDSLINFREFVSGLSKDAIFLHELGGAVTNFMIFPINKSLIIHIAINLTDAFETIVCISICSFMCVMGSQCQDHW